jgi:hypothetical protein
MAEPTYTFKITVSRSDLPGVNLDVTLEDVAAADARAPGYPLVSVVRNYDAMTEEMVRPSVGGETL